MKTKSACQFPVCPLDNVRRVQETGGIGESTPVAAFTLMELIVVLGATTLLLAVAMPLLAGNRSSSDRAVCQSNLRQIGRAFNMWADDHGGRYPYDAASGSPVPTDPLANNVWYQILSLQSELGSPKVLVCPTDADKGPASDWSNSANGGFIHHATGRNRSISYTIGLGTRYDPRGYLSSDRNISGSETVGGWCAGPAYAGVPRLNWSAPDLDWTEKLHNKSGNIVRFDGSVISADQSALRTAVYYGSGCSVQTGYLAILYPN